MKNLIRRGAIRGGLPAMSQISIITPPASIIPSIIPDKPPSLFSRSIFSSPSTSPFVGMRQFSSATQKSSQKIDASDVEIVTLMPKSEEDFQTFKKILTDEKVVFTSSWIDQYFGISTLKDFCADFETQLK